MLRIILLFCTLSALVSCTGTGAPLSPPPPGALRIASHNAHYIVLGRESGKWSVGDWATRRIALNQSFKALDADIIAYQEMESFGRGDTDNVNLARDWVLANNPDYAVGANGDSAVFPSTQPIFYRTDRLELLDQGWFFFSDTPDVIYSRTFDGSFPAFASWVQLRDLQDGRSFYVYNVHFEYRSGSNRLKSAALTVERMQPLLARAEPIVLVGDLNALKGSRTAQIFKDAGFSFADVRGSTYHLDRGLNLFGAIDQIATAGPIRQAGTPQVLRRKFEDRWPSDHYPVISDVFLE
ncbi:endonuclease/exonuclease/phosphatase family protein [Loktanella sp. SALINAS62]|uniref:endonuclease/exonuclease/phosphatase family protein n=1 Tax=Loktanella sp. SALINAS62 TaxID=2706124 RepID=UPI001B8D7B63|nr:endonuclease/exonuclease/phosphatase family protein [Loktanella sp. SALINAS62]MBS1300729.1 endonuclease [Loktanella sp. SALINAS62]